MFKDNEYHIAKYWDGTYCYINNQGEVILNGDYEEAYPFSEGLALVTIDHKDVFIDYDGNVVIDLPTDGQTSYTILGSFHTGLARCKIGDSARSLRGECYINKEGDEELTFLASYENTQMYNGSSDFSEGYAVIGYGILI